MTLHKCGSRSLRLVFCAALVAALAGSATGSEGDAADVFWSCMDQCQRSGCACRPPQPGCCAAACRLPSSPPLSLSLRLARWDCHSDCSYHCMWSIEGPKAASRSGPVYKYFGKWPFVRVVGSQEIASVVFSLANLAAHAHNLHLYLSKLQQARVTSREYPFKYVWVLYSLTSINAWWWSSVFHTRDTRVTEKFDYFSADLLVTVGAATCVTRVLELTKAPGIVATWVTALVIYLQHIYYLAFIKFDYGYNMQVCIAAGVATAAGWLVWATATKHPGRRPLYTFLGLLHLAMLLEVLDFPPLAWLFDAHSLWHLATAPMTYLWYDFILVDVQAWRSSSSSSSSGKGTAATVAAEAGAGKPGAATAAAGSSSPAIAALIPGRKQSPDLGKYKNGD